MTPTPSLDSLFDLLAEHERKLNRSFSLIPSENMLSPLARAAFLSDAFSRYFFDEREVFGRWSFEGGSIAGRIQQTIVVPLLREIGRAAFVNVHPISGLTGMTLVLAAFGGEPGSAVLSVPVANGGHPDTSYVAAKLGYRVHEIPFAAWHALDAERLADRVAELSPALVYVDHATSLVPLDLRALVAAVRAGSRSRVHVHVDSSHVNGLVWGGQLPHPLECGADTYGGSTHKTFPGPHKAVIFTDDADLDDRLTLTAVNMISHHHLSSVIALGITLLEWRDCNGAAYAAQVLRNAAAFAQALARRGVAVEGVDGALTRTHQVWARAPVPPGPYDTASALFRAGMVVNPYNPVPSVGGPAIRMGLNEPSRLGMHEEDMELLADVFADVAIGGGDVDRAAQRVAEHRVRFDASYCYTGERAEAALATLGDVLEDGRAAYVGGMRSSASSRA